MMMMIKKHAFINMYAFELYIRIDSILFQPTLNSMPLDTIYNGATRSNSGRQTPYVNLHLNLLLHAFLIPWL